MDISLVLTRKYADCLWELHGFEYEGLVWLDESDKPSLDELESQYSQVVYEIEYKRVEETRKSLYTQNSDPLFFSYQRGENTYEEWEASVNEIKLNNPYPEVVS
jgi:hypothetical protein